MNKNTLFVFLSMSVVASDFSAPLQARVERLERKDNERIARQQLEQSLLLVEICRSNIPPLIAGAPLGILGFFIGSLIDWFSGLCYYADAPQSTFKIMLASGGFAIGYIPIARIQYLMLKKLSIKNRKNSGNRSLCE